MRTWTTLAYCVLLLPLGVAYFAVAMVGLPVGLGISTDDVTIEGFLHDPLARLPAALLGVLIRTLLMHLARAIGRGHARLANALLVHG